MAENSSIGWTDHTQNFWWGCNKVSDECKFCYIAAIMKRGGFEPFKGPMRTKNWRNPIRWDRQAERDGHRARVFTCSMSDFFHPGADKWRGDAWKVVEDCPNLDWLILTKRPERIIDCLPHNWGVGYSNVWLGVTAGRKESLERVKLLVKIPAVVRFVSAEPLLERMSFRRYLPKIDWIITGCERAKKGDRRVMELDWVRDIDRQCSEAGVSHFFKQYYRGETGVPCEDGMLDGVCRQQWPTPRTPANVGVDRATAAVPGVR